MNNKIEHIAIKYLNKFYGDLINCKTKNHPGGDFFIKDDTIYIEVNLKFKSMHVYSTIWSDLEDTFLLSNYEIQSILIKWIEEKYNFKDIIINNTTPFKGKYSFSNLLK